VARACAVGNSAKERGRALGKRVTEGKQKLKKVWRGLFCNGGGVYVRCRNRSREGRGHRVRRDLAGSKALGIKGRMKGKVGFGGRER